MTVENRPAKPTRWEKFIRLLTGEQPPAIWKFGSVDVEIPPHQAYVIPILNSHEWNIRNAAATGIRPISLGDILGQIPQYTIENMVFFDTNPLTGNGNHLRVISVDPETVELQVCGRFGNYDLAVPAFRYPLDEPAFTGVSVQYYAKDGQTMTLEQVSKYSQKEMIHDRQLSYVHDEEILWSNGDGRLHHR
jgi:hypothetical protein